MRKTITYSGFAISTLLVVLAFVTAKTYIQLAIAILLYPIVAYFALRFFPRGREIEPEITIPIPQAQVKQVETQEKEKVEVTDIDKRTFIKLIGAAGVSFFLFSLLGKKVESLLFGKTLQSGINQGATDLNQPVDGSGPSTTSGYRITEIDDSTVAYYGFTNKDGAWFIMREDTESGSFRYSKGGSDFTHNWENRSSLKYDYYHNLF